MSLRVRGVQLFIMLMVLAYGQVCCAAPKYLFKVASVAPDGSVWAQHFRDFVKEVATKSNGDIGFRVYLGGAMGDDRAMYRKMQVGQLHGGGFTMTGIGPVVQDFRVMGIPFLFNSYDEVDQVRKGLNGSFKKAFAEKGLEFLAFTEVGFVYAMSTSPITTLPQLQAAKCWLPEGDPVSAEFFSSIGVSPIPLTIPDVLTSLQTGMINTVFNGLYGSIVLQWFTKATFVTDIPFGYAYGAFLLDRRKFASMPPHYAEIVRAAATRHFQALLEDTRKSNFESRDVLKENGVAFVKPTPDSLAELIVGRDDAVTRMRGKAFSKEIYDETIRLLKENRQ
ncbi:MAG: TRAP transporter substrate-binding protein DctP [Thermodesulfobacteriota bacterium]